MSIADMRREAKRCKEVRVRNRQSVKEKVPRATQLGPFGPASIWVLLLLTLFKEPILSLLTLCRALP
jgi:hypothetical protein